MMNKVVLLSAGLLCSHVIVYSQPISPLLVGQNVWMNPDQTVWQRVSEVGVGSIRIGGISYDNNIHSCILDISSYFA